jgi:hypothetical protein
MKRGSILKWTICAVAISLMGYQMLKTFDALGELIVAMGG